MRGQIYMHKHLFNLQQYFYLILMKKSIIILICFSLTVFQISASIFDQQFNIPKANSSCTQDCCKSLPSRPAQTYTFYQKTGRFKGGSGAYAVDVHGYSGQGSGYLNPDYECVINTGPLPVGKYNMSSCVNTMHSPPVQRPCSFVLTPFDQSKMCGRSAFLVHGCNCCTPGDSTIPPTAGCSAGCVVINYENRIKLRVGDTLIVQHYEPAMQTEIE